MRSGRAGAWRSTLAPGIIRDWAFQDGLQAALWQLARDDPRRRAFLGAAEGNVSLLFFTGTPMPRCSHTAQELHSSTQSALGLPQSRLKSILGRPITNNTSCLTARIDAPGRLKSISGQPITNNTNFPTARVDAPGHSLLNRNGRLIRRHQAAPRPPRKPSFKVAQPS